MDTKKIEAFKLRASKVEASRFYLAYPEIRGLCDALTELIGMVEAELKDKEEMIEGLKSVEYWLADFWNYHHDLWSDEALDCMTTLEAIRSNLEGKSLPKPEEPTPVKEQEVTIPVLDDLPF